MSAGVEDADELEEEEEEEERDCLTVRLPASLTACLCVCARTDMRGNTLILTRERCKNKKIL